jgi:hypothetical protein
MMVTGASLGPKEKSIPLTGGKYDSVLGADVGSALIAEQLTADVGVSAMTGFTSTGGEVGVACWAQALRMKRALIKNKRKECFFMGFLAAGRFGYIAMLPV